MAKAKDIIARTKEGNRTTRLPSVIREVHHPNPFTDDDGASYDWIVTRVSPEETILLRGAHSAVEAKRFCLFEIWKDADPAFEAIEVARYVVEGDNGKHDQGQSSDETGKGVRRARSE